MKLTEAEKKLYDLGFTKKEESPNYIYYYFQSSWDKSTKGAIILDKENRLRYQAKNVWVSRELNAAIRERQRELGWEDPAEIRTDKARWQGIIDDAVPFGFKVEEDNS